MTLHVLLLLALTLFCLGLVCVLSRRNLIIILIGIELMLNAASLNFMAFNKHLSPDPAIGQVVVLLIIGLAAAEVAIFLSILMVVNRAHNSIDAQEIRELKG